MNFKDILSIKKDRFYVVEVESYENDGDAYSSELVVVESVDEVKSLVDICKWLDTHGNDWLSDEKLKEVHSMTENLVEVFGDFDPEGWEDVWSNISLIAGSPVSEHYGGSFVRGINRYKVYDITKFNVTSEDITDEI